MKILSVLNRLEPYIDTLEENKLKINGHKSNARIANTGAALAYLFTNNSENSTVKTFGRIATVGGLAYGYSEQNNATNITSSNINIISKIIEIVESEGINFVRQENDANLLKRFIVLNLKTGKHLDELVLENISRIKNKGRLGKKNIDLLLNLNYYDVFNYKLRLNSIYKKLDTAKLIQDIEEKYSIEKQEINVDKLLKEGLYSRIIIITFIVLGLLPYQSNNLNKILIIIGLLFWLINHYFPLFPQTKKLKIAVDNFTNNINSTCGIISINYK